MAQSSPKVSINPSRLVRFLAEISASDIEISHKQFAERLSLLVDLADSVTLSESIRGLSRLTLDTTSDSSSGSNSGSNSGKISESTVQDVFMQQRTAIMKSIVKSFGVSGSKTGFVPFSLPQPKQGDSIEDAINFEPYLRFYGLHQSEMEFKIQKLRTLIRKGISVHSVTLYRLAELDQALAKSLMTHTRKRFSLVPKLLKARFEALFKDYRDSLSTNIDLESPIEWVKEDAWLAIFYNEMQQCLLAEFEVRLQPVLGLVEAFNAELANEGRKND